MWDIEQDEDTGSYVAAWDGMQLPRGYKSREEAMESLLNYISEYYGDE